MNTKDTNERTRRLYRLPEATKARRADALRQRFARAMNTAADASPRPGSRRRPAARSAVAIGVGGLAIAALLVGLAIWLV